MSDLSKQTGITGNGHKAVHSIPVRGEGGIAYEGTDAPAKVVIYSLAIVAALGVAAFVLMFGYEKVLEWQQPKPPVMSPLAKERVVPPAPQIERLPWLDLPEMRAHEEEVLNSSGKDKDGHVHVPIDKAMDDVVNKLNTHPNEPAGIDEPGGQDRVFSHSLADMPAPYQHSQATLQGEIHKNAQ